VRGIGHNPGAMRREHAVLVQLLRADRTAAVRSELAPAQPLDWNALVDTADAHGVTEQLLAPLTAIAAQVPPAVLRRVGERVVHLAAINLRYTRQLATLLDHLQAHGIRALAFKGPSLAAGMYGHLGARSSADLDLLVDRRSALRVRPLLMAQGYTLPPRRRKRGGALLYGLAPGAGRDDTLYPPHDDLAMVDVHVAFAFWTQGVRLDTRAMFAQAITIEISGVRVPTLCADDLLLVLAIHGMMHGWCILRLVRDIDVVASHVADWDAVLSRARAARMRRVLHVALLLAHDLLGTRLPPHVLATAAQDETAGAIAASVPPRLFDPPATWDPYPWFRAHQDTALGRLRYEARTLLYEWFLKWPWDEWLGRRRAPEGAH
jgi:hypothetical protein